MNAVARYRAARERLPPFWQRLVVLIAFAGALGTAAATYYQHQANGRILTARLDGMLGVVVQRVDARMHNYLSALQGVRGVVLVAAPDAVGQKALSTYVTSIGAARQFPGARAFGFIRRVKRADEAVFIARQRREQAPDFMRRPLGPNDGDRFLIQLIEPLKGHLGVLGLDIASEPNRRSAALAAMDSALPRMTAPITLVQSASRKGQASLLLLPVYATPAAPGRAAREAALVGWTFAPLLIDAILDDLVAADGSMQLGLADVTDGRALTVLPWRAGTAVAQTATEMDVYGRRWRLTLGAGEKFVRQQDLTSPLTLFAIGMAATLALTALALLAGMGRSRRFETRAEQAKLAAIVDSSIDAIIGKDLDGRISSWNRGAETLFGYRADEAIGQTTSALLVPPARRNEEHELLARFAAGATMAHVETQRLHKQGHLVDVWMAIAPVTGPGGKVAGLASTVRDITGRKAAEARVHAANVQLEETVASRTAQLQQINTLLGSVLDAATGVAIIATDNAGTITVFNRGAERMLGRAAGEVVGRAGPMLFHDAAEVALRAAELSAAAGRPVSDEQTILRYPQRAGEDSVEWTYVHRDGGRIAVSLIVSTMRGADGRVAGYLGIAVDVTGRRALLDSLREAKLAADAASEAKSTFLANMSHEIRTPMNAVLGMLQLVQMTDLDSRQQDYVGKAEQAGRSLLQLLNDVLDFSKIEAGQLRLDPHPFEIDGLMRELGVILSGNHGGKPVEILFDMDPALPGCVVGDRLRLQQVLINLAGNALKFTERGSVSVSLELLARDGDALAVRIAVRDTGIGIAQDQRERIFASFTQADASISRRFGGSGLGLVICRRLVELMGSTLELDSTAGAGSVFWFDLDLRAGPAPAVAAPRALRVLVVDDHPDAGAALLRMIRGLGWEASMAGGGAQALALLRADAGFDIVLLDWRMPGLDGLATAHAIRGAGPRAPVVIMVTAAGRDSLLSASDDAAAAPFADVLTKPVTPQLIAQAVTRALAGRMPAAAPPRARPCRLAGLAVMVVEDNALNRQVARELLASEGARVSIAEDGSLAVRQLLAAQGLPDVVLMDMQMPVMDGLEATRRIRAALGPALPIIAMTANASAADRARCLAAGMDEHIGKPIDLEVLVRLLRPAAALAAPAAAGDAGDADEAVATVLTRFGQDAALYLRSVEGFAAQAPALFGQARAALEQGEAGAAADILHNLRGMAATVGARGLARRLGDCEGSLRGGAGCAPVLVLVSGFESDLAAACVRLGAAARPLAGTRSAPARAAPDLAQLARLLESGNMHALELGEQVGAHAVPGSLQEQLAGEIAMLDFAAARATLARLV